MKLPAKIEYACRAVVELALRYNKESPVQLRTISEAQNIPLNFLLQLFLRLKNAGIVNSSRGVSGGYFLAKQPSELTLADVIKAVDDGIIDKPKFSKISGQLNVAKLIRSVWYGISNEVVRQLEGISLENLVSQIKNEKPTYYI